MTGTTNATGEIADAVLVEAARRGDLYAWERIVRRYQEPVYRVAFLIIRDSALAETAARSTFVRAYRALPSYRDDIGVLPWIFRIAAGESRQQRREAGRPRRSSRPLERITGPHYPASTVPGLDAANGLTPSEREAVGEAFDRLGEEDRLTLATRYLFGLSRADASNALSIASGLVDEHLHTALRRLRTRMADA
ncbi:MAG TPA: sigma-70 family RNA polymerase sigma factor [Candidatus Limnocylindrales bacterium]|jgi:RNA polymerase sigma-70 factor (ECF subfamily)|nr:sigma-70 family RNA polymerase sigma factor [Candidatus Limnocylindrales bacterium]